MMKLKFVTKKMKRFDTITTVVDKVLATLTVITEVSCIVVLVSDIGLPFEIALGGVGIVSLLARLTTLKASKIFIAQQKNTIQLSY